MRFSRLVLLIAVLACGVISCPRVLHAETTVKVPVSLTIGDLKDFDYTDTFFSTGLGLEAEWKYVFFRSLADYSPNDKNLGQGRENGHSYGTSGYIYGKIPTSKGDFLLGGKVSYGKTKTSDWEKEVTRYLASVGYGTGNGDQTAKIFLHYIVTTDRFNNLSGGSIEAWLDLDPHWRVGADVGYYRFRQGSDTMEAITGVVTFSYDLNYFY